MTVKCKTDGSDLSIYYDTAADQVVGPNVYVFHEGVVGDLTFNHTDDEDEYIFRGEANLFKQYRPGKTTLSIDGTQVTDPTYEGNAYLWGMGNGGEAKNILALTGQIDIEGNVGYQGMMHNFNNTTNGPETGRSDQNFNLKPAACVELPVRLVRTNDAGGLEDWEPWDGPITISSLRPQHVYDDKMKEEQRLASAARMVNALRRVPVDYIYLDPHAALDLVGPDSKKLGTYFRNMQKLLAKPKRKSARPESARIRNFQVAEYDRVLLLDAVENSVSQSVMDLADEQDQKQNFFRAVAAKPTSGETPTYTTPRNGEFSDEDE